MKKKEFARRLKDLEERVAELERIERDRRQNLFLPLMPWRQGESVVGCPNGCEYPSHYYSPDGKIPCTKCGKVAQFERVTWTHGSGQGGMG